MQGDHNLVLYRNSDGQALWSSNTTNRPYIAYCDFRYNGELYLVQNGGYVWWQAGVMDSAPNHTWILQDDGNFCKYSYDANWNLQPGVASTGTQGGQISSHRTQ